MHALFEMLTTRMPKFAANLSTLFTEVPFLERFECAARAGFKAVEFQYAYDVDVEDIAERLTEHELVLALLNAPRGEDEAGAMGLAAVPGCESAFRASLRQALAYAERLECPNIHVLAGNMGPHIDAEAAMATYLANLKWACNEVAKSPVTLLIEAINSRDKPRYFLNSPTDARAVIDAVDEDNLGLLLDLYHCQVMEGDLSAQIDQHLLLTEHMQIAGVPGRHEPDVGEVNYPYLFEQIDAAGYRGYIGCEYFPADGTDAGLGWLAPYQA